MCCSNFVIVTENVLVNCHIVNMHMLLAAGSFVIPAFQCNIQLQSLSFYVSCEDVKALFINSAMREACHVEGLWGWAGWKLSSVDVVGWRVYEWCEFSGVWAEEMWILTNTFAEDDDESSRQIARKASDENYTEILWQNTNWKLSSWASLSFLLRVVKFTQSIWFRRIISAVSCR